MTLFLVRIIALGALLPVLFGAQPTLAQNQPALEVRQPAGAEELGRYLSRLAANPRDVDALVGAGEAALRLNDPRAATGFFARAQEISPGNVRVKTGLARSTLGMENPVESLRLFDEAVRLGTREADIAFDRGLAYDLTGDPVRAQRDYKMALERDPRNAVLIRRYAVSLGISGNWQEADKLLDPLLRKSDRSAWRDRAFIFAMNGRVKQAKDITDVMMPRNMAAAIQPFMDRMPSLTPAQRAAAVHFGNFPAGTVRTAAAGIPAAPSSKPVGPVAPVASVLPNRQRPRAEPPRPVAPQTVSPSRPAVLPPARTAALPLPEPRRLSDRATPPAATADRIGPPAQEPAPTPIPPPPPEPRRSLAEIMSTVAVPEAERTTAVAPVDLAEIARIQAEKRRTEQAAAAKVKAEADARAKAKADAEAKAKAKAEAAEKAKNPARIWVQIATGRDTKALAFDMGKLRKKYPDQLKGKDAWTSPWGATRRMVIGPFANMSGAKIFAFDWMKAGGDGYIWQSTEGLEVEKLTEK